MEVQFPIVDCVEGSCNLEVSATNKPGDDMLKIDSNRTLVFSLECHKHDLFNTIYQIVDMKKSQTHPYYRVTIPLVQNIPLTSKPKFHFGLACPGLARPKWNFCLAFKGRF